MRCCLICILGVLSLSSAFGQDLIIQNARLPDSDRERTGPLVTLVIRGGVLDLVTTDTVKPKTTQSVYDAAEGHILGTLAIGAKPSFMIFNGDPQKNVELLLDTRRYAIFAMHEGEVLKNELAEDDGAIEGDDMPRRWIAHTPPPLALPIDYLNQRKWNRFDTRYVSGLFAAGVVLDRQRWLDQDSASLTQVGDLDAFNGGELRGLMFGFVGTINLERPWTYSLLVADNTFDKGFDAAENREFAFRNIRVDIPVLERSALSVGKQKEPISIGRLMAGVSSPIGDERPALLDALLPSRNTGIVYSGRWGQDDGNGGTYAAGVFNDFLEDEGSFSDNSTEYIGRLTHNPYVSQDRDTVFHIGAGARYSNGKEGFATRVKPEFNQAPFFLDATLAETDSQFTMSLEGAVIHGPWTFIGEYIRHDMESTAFGDISFDGYYLSANWIATGERRPYLFRQGVPGVIPVAQPTTAGGSGTLEVMARLSHLDMSESRDNGGEMDTFTLGVNWWLTQSLAVGAMYRYIGLEQGGLSGASHGVMSRITLLLE